MNSYRADSPLVRIHVERSEASRDTRVVQPQRTEQGRGAHLVDGTYDLTLDADSVQHARLRSVQAYTIYEQILP